MRASPASSSGTRPPEFREIPVDSAVEGTSDHGQSFKHAKNQLALTKICPFCSCQKKYTDCWSLSHPAERRVVPSSIPLMLAGSGTDCDPGSFTSQLVSYRRPQSEWIDHLAMWCCPFLRDLLVNPEDIPLQTHVRSKKLGVVPVQTDPFFDVLGFIHVYIYI